MEEREQAVVKVLAGAEALVVSINENRSEDDGKGNRSSTAKHSEMIVEPGEEKHFPLDDYTRILVWTKAGDHFEGQF